jgi:hypothetical protein
MKTLAPGIAALLAAAPLAAQPFPDARATDPEMMGWMQGFPPPADKIVGFTDLGYFTFPKTRWSFSNYRQFGPTVGITRADRSSPLPRAERADIDVVTFTPIGGGTPMRWFDSLLANYTDGIIVLHRGRVVYERYFGVTTPETQHIAFSVTKSFVGTLAEMLIAEGRLDPDALVTRYVPELDGSGFGDATVRQVMDMTTGLDFDETYINPQSDIYAHAMAGSIGPRPAGYDGPEGFYAYLKTVRKAGEHGERFTYRSVNSDALGWIVARVTGEPLHRLIEQRFWKPLGMERDAAMQVDRVGTVFAGGGLMAALRDLARFGEMLRLGGKAGRRQIIPAAAVASIEAGASKADFAKAGYATLPGWSYKSQWWVSHNAHGAYMARGVHGQAIYIDPKAEMVIARFASHPMAGNVNLDPTSLPAFQALAVHLLATGR